MIEQARIIGTILNEFNLQSIRVRWRGGNPVSSTLTATPRDPQKLKDLKNQLKSDPGAGSRGPAIPDETRRPEYLRNKADFREKLLKMAQQQDRHGRNMGQ